MTKTQIRRSYRATLVLDLRGATESPDALIEKLKDTFKAVDAAVSEVRNLGQREFARVVDRRLPSGLYVQFDFKAPVTAPVAFREKLRLDRTVNRILIQSV
jgi:small subunit ribosomal protein S6